MNIKLLFVITNSEQKLERVINHFKLPFNVITHGLGTATRSMLDFFNLSETEKYISLSLYPSSMEIDLYNRLDKFMKLKEIGNGIAFSVPLSSSSAYVQDSFKIKEEYKGMEANEHFQSQNYHLLLTIVQEGYSQKAMDAAKKSGANGGTVINGRALGGKSSFKFFNMTIEPEKEIVLIVCNSQNKNDIMNSILNKTGLKTEGKGYCISLPIDAAIGLN